MAISENLLQTTRESMRELLNRFEGKITFEPIDVEPRVDHDDEENIGIVVVFHSDEGLLDHRKLNLVSSQLGTVFHHGVSRASNYEAEPSLQRDPSR